MNLAKIQLSQEELLFVQNAEWLLTKNRIIAKVYEMFGSLIVDAQKLFSVPSLLPSEIFLTPPKISKGENYNGLPYVMLDYPRCFGKCDIFAIRTMFWWGNFFSTTLHLKGKYQNELAPVLKKHLPVLAASDFFISIHNDEWRHDFEADNYLAIRSADAVTVNENLIRKDFCKLSGKVSLAEWNDAPAKLLRFYETIIGEFKINFQGGGRGL
ncbi:MAG: hypothetical protein H7122_04915 [Chitinophagaceae bacterium]|nr:hypothetical protein [Chitinophagaceae bacterium]